MAPLLFIHGAWHGAWCWHEHFAPYFRAAGYDVHTLDLPGHGELAGQGNLRTTRVRDYVMAVARAAEGLPEAPVVIGHSMGGLVAQKYLETHPARAGVLLASVPPRGVLPVALRIARHHPLRFLRANLTMRLYPLVETPALARELFFSASMPDAQVEAYQRRLNDESYFAFLDMLAFDLPEPARVTVPMLVLGAENDTIFPPPAVRATARAYGSEPIIFPDMAHDMMLEAGWEQVAAQIHGWLATQGIEAGRKG